MTQHVTIVEDDADIREVLVRGLEADGYRVTALEYGTGVVDVVAANNSNLIVLDIGLPDLDGLSIIRKIRRNSDVAIIIVSGRIDLADKVVGLEIGADDYITKPFELRELKARIRSVMRRGRLEDNFAITKNDEGHSRYEFGNWTLDIVAQSLRDGSGRLVELTNREFNLLKVMVMRARQVLTREQLVNVCCGSRAPAHDRSIDVCIARLRKKLGENVRSASFIRTVRNGGYQFVAPVTKY